MKKLLIAVFCLPLFSQAQNFHFSARLGLAGYAGDLKAKQISLGGNSLMGSLGARYDLTERIALRSYLTLTSLKADDKKGTPGMQSRNLNFKSGFFGWETSVQYSFLNPNESWWIPYAFVGVELFHFNPKTKDVNGQTVKLQPLSTEGQGVINGVKKYKLTQFSVPMGIGIERSLNEDMRLGLELGYHFTNTDYIDDVSGVYVDPALLLDLKGQETVDLAYRGYEVGAGPYPPAGTQRGAKSKDGYYYFAVTYTVRYFFDKYKQIAGLPAYKRDKKAGCPSTRY
ncbi:MAG: DUF6089 family protein [Chitinophagaceae bacterium]